MSNDQKSEKRVKFRVTVVAALGAYAWVMTGAAPFTATSYLLVAIPCALFLTSYVAFGGLSIRHPRVSTRASWHKRRLGPIAPWLVLLVAALVLETVGLALGGHSKSVPTLSTTIDHLLARHWERFLFGTAWLLVGATVLSHLREARHSHGAEL